MLPVKRNETTVCVRVPLKVSLYESSDGLTFMAPAESIKKSNQGMLPRVQNQIMSEERGSVFVGNLLNQGKMSSIISLIATASCLFFLVYCTRTFEAFSVFLVANYPWQVHVVKPWKSYCDTKDVFIANPHSTLTVLIMYANFTKHVNTLDEPSKSVHARI